MPTEMPFRDFKPYSPVEVLRRVELYVQSRKHSDLPYLTVYLENGLSLSGWFMAQSGDGKSLLLKGEANGKMSEHALYLDVHRIQCVRLHDVQPLAGTLRGATLGRVGTERAPSRLQLARHIEATMQQLSTHMGSSITATVDWGVNQPAEDELLNVQDVFNTISTALRTAGKDEFGKQAIKEIESLNFRYIPSRSLHISKSNKVILTTFDFSMVLPENYETALSDELNRLL